MKLILFILAAVFLAGTTDVKSQNSRVDSLLTIIDSHWKANNYPEAIEYYELVLPLLLQEKDSVSWYQHNIFYAEYLIRAGSVRKSLEHFKKLDSLNFKNAPFYLIATVKRQIGYTYRLLEDYENAIKYYQEGIKLAEEAKDPSVIARFQNNIGVIYQRKKDYDMAFHYLSQALNLFEDLDSPTMLGKVNNAIFLTYMGVGLYPQAEPYIRKSLRIHSSLNQIHDMDVAYHNLAWFHERQNQLDSAIIYYNKSLELTRQIGNPFEIDRTLRNIGILYQNIGEFDVADQYFEEALNINRQTNRPVSTADALMLLAENALSSNKILEAELFYEEAQKIYSEHNSPDNLVFMQIKLAELEVERGSFENARNYINEARILSNQHNLRKRLFFIHKLNAELDLAEGNLRDGIHSYKNALGLANTMSDKITILKPLAQAYYNISSDSAFVFAEEAVQIISDLRTRVSGLTFGAGTFGNHTDFFNELATWYISQDRDAERAFELVEAAKSRVLMDELARAQNEAYALLAEDEQIKRQQKVKALNELFDEFNNESDVKKRKELETALRQAEFDYQAYQNVINLENPQYKNLKNPQVANLDQAKNLLDNQSAIIEYAFAGSKLITFFITKNAVQTVVTDSANGQSALDFIAQSVTQLLHQVEEIQPVELIKRSSSELYKLLARDFLNDNPQIEKLLVISDGPVTYLPFELLFDEEKNAYLTQNFIIKYAPSVSIIPFIKDPHRVDSRLLALAGSGFSEMGGARQTRGDESYASLPSAILEVESIATHFDDAQIFKNNSLSEATLKSKKLDTYRFLHFATHGKIDLENPGQSGLLISNMRSSASTEDGFLNNLEISLLNLNADLVVLSACKTGIGKKYSGEGLFGLQRSFLIAGASAVIVSLWDVYDRSTSEFMNYFYADLLKYQREDYRFFNKSLAFFGLYEHPVFDYKARALQSAKINMINHPYHNHPVHWAPFILIGK